jgi:hypothetical protein
MLGITIRFVNTEPILTIFGFVGFLVFLGSGFDVVFPWCLETFALHETKDNNNVLEVRA